MFHSGKSEFKSTKYNMNVSVYLNKSNSVNELIGNLAFQ